MPNQDPYQFSLSPMYSSQSATSTYMTCPRRRLFNNHIYGTGIVPIYKSIPLTTGACVHTGIQHLVEGFLLTGSGKIDSAVNIATAEYGKLLKDKGFLNTKEEEQQNQIKEQIALTEALLRIWYLLEWPSILEYYDILAVEQEIEFPLATMMHDDKFNDIIYAAKPDLILRHKQSGDVINYSLKTIKSLDDRIEKSYKVNLQVATEPYATEIWLRRIKDNANEAIQATNSMGLDKSSAFSQIPKISKYLAKLADLPTSPSATRFCYLIKGDRTEEHKGNGDYRTSNPFIYGYRKFTPSGIEYAAEWRVSKPENKSGWGILGKGWEKFSVWECAEVGGIKGWLWMIEVGKQVSRETWDGKDIFNQWCVSMPEVYNNPKLRESRIEQVKSKEQECYANLTILQNDPEMIDTLFPQHTHSCYFPSNCDYLTICNQGGDYYKEHIANDPLSGEFGMYERRISHHEGERLYLINEITSND